MEAPPTPTSSSRSTRPPSQGPLTVALTGGTGFVGRHVLPALLERGHRVRVLVRGAGRLPASDSRVQAVVGDLLHAPSLAELVRGCDAVVHLVGIIMEKPWEGQTFEGIHALGTQNLVKAAQAAGVTRWVQMSALGTRPDAASRYHQTKWIAEEAVRGSGLAWTIIRPSLIHGPDGEFIRMVKDFWCRAFPPFVPYFSRTTRLRDVIEVKTAFIPGFIRRPARWLLNLGDPPPTYISDAPAGLLQPVWVEDVARCFADALTLKRTFGEVYPLGGPDEYTWPQFYVTCKRHLRGARDKKVAPVPAWYARMIAGLPGVPFNRDQVIMSQEDSTCRISKVEEDFGIQLAAFEPTFADYAARIP